jgi:hypothetical protein
MVNVAHYRGIGVTTKLRYAGQGIADFLYQLSCYGYLWSFLWVEMTAKQSPVTGVDNPRNVIS